MDRPIRRKTARRVVAPLSGEKPLVLGSVTGLLAASAATLAVPVTLRKVSDEGLVLGGRPSVTKAFGAGSRPRNVSA